MGTESTWHRIIRTMRRHFLAGILMIVPLVATIAVLVWFFVNVDNILQPAIQLVFGRRIVGVGFGIAVIFIYITGIIASNIFGRRILRFGETIVTKIPLFRQIYRGFRQVVDGFSGYKVKTAAFREVVLVDFPREGMKALAFITNEIVDENGKPLFTIFVPTTPIPTSGYFVIVTEDMLTRTSLTVDEAMKMIISSGMVAPLKINTTSVDDSL
ncbi:DUF502 domain-containing protein [Chloroflexota bacterium]